MKRKLAVMSICAALIMMAAGGAFAAKQAPATPVDVNSATVEQLMSIPGLGQAKAQAIVAYRAATPFSAPEELINVKGIGEKLYAKISPYVVVVGKNQQAKPGTAEKAVR